MVVTIWKEAGFFMIFYLAALQSMSPHLAEAAAIEGASRWYFFRRVTFPLLMPTTLFVLVNAVINAFRLVDHIVVMTRGGPDNATALLLYYIYEIGFRFWDSAYAAALTMVLLALLGLRGARAVLVPRAPGPLPMSAAPDPRAARYRARARDARRVAARAPVDAAAALRGVDRVPSAEFSTRFELSAPLTLENFAQRLARRAVRALLPQHGDARDDGARGAARAGARSPPTRSRASSFRAATCCSRSCWCS